ncbi:phosphorylcholine transferase LicD [Methanobrevibacter sp.]|uniref:LicD family protein n=1 Tax=Methanobrevibacter sp. TaxID=66852 RepID=UPI00386D16D4
MFFDKSKNEIKKEDLIPRKDYDRLNNLVKTHQDYLNNIYVFYKLKPTPFLASIRSLSYELMKFFDNVCEKYDLSYWIGYGTLLGAVRHNDFVPWDDDLDVGMMRKDYMKFIDVIQDEIDEKNIENLTVDYKIDKRDKKSKRWFQISYYVPDFQRKVIGIDIFPHDFIDGEPIEGFEEKYYESRAKYYKRRNKSDDMEDIIGKLYDELNLSLDPQKYFTHGVESVHGNVNIFPFEIVESDELFPLQRIPFGEYEFSAPKNPHTFLLSAYGKRYMRIPKKIRDHGRLTYYKEIENVEEIFNKASNSLKKVNDTYGV